eukprot:CAMPEP_0194213224 /NCGR_PEP_ID=MMETSP0156-20130528/13612_1 /TAXON_ID=33649 /ORGANISM="Thalassionema nitzschioides, Strain L26-B" /LENGTH=649 /DNA_ID=CAMNT_0038941209 /DNA_START=354 /DNA_END=2303 /DNA_ORIENTATION=+
MTPFKPKQMFLDYDDESMVSSPPHEKPIPKLPNANLFGNETSSPRRPRRLMIRKTSSSSTSSSGSSGFNDDSVLRPLNFNSDSPHGSRQRKRPNDSTYPVGREDSWENDDVDMFQSPRPTPGGYRTLDGRTVTSKNPFSPYTPAESMDDADSYQLTPMQSVPEFPEATLHLPSTTPSKLSSISLSQRKKQSTPFQQTYFGPTSNGYPDRHGRYSFTGSPIEEIDTDNLSQTILLTAASKVRRLHIQDNAVSRRPLSIDTAQANAEASSSQIDEVSPSDVMSFPTPPTPMKAARSTYTYVRTNNGPPPTPSVNRQRHEDQEEDDDSILITTSSTSQKPKSRFSQDFDVIGQLGDGSFGTVYKCLSRLDGCMYAVKAAKRKAKGTADRDRMLKEVYALAALSDQADTAAFHIVRYHQAWMEENRLYIQTELCSYTLDAEMKKGPLSIQRRYKLLREILVALEFIHRNSMVHLDIKPENIFVKNDQYKLGDFGLVSKVGYNKDVEEGDSRYMSMELLNAGADSDLTKSDIFSMGATMYEISTGHALPLNGQEWQDIRSNTFRPFVDTPFTMERIIKEMMHSDPVKRPQPPRLLKNTELLSEEQKQLLMEKRKVIEVNMALALQTERMKKLTPPRPGGLTRANTWNGSLPQWL